MFIPLTSALPVMVPIIKVVGDFCNLRCSYCFYHEQDQKTKHVMSEKLLEKFICEYFENFSGNLRFIWHGGEPLLAGIPFFERVLQLQERHRHDKDNIQNVIQTNGTLISDEWAQFLFENKFGVGVSLDGAEESHDNFRKTASGKGSLRRVLDGIEILRKHGIEPGVIQTLPRDSTYHVNKDFAFFVDKCSIKGWGINPYLDMGDLNESMTTQSVSNGELVSYLKQVIDLWLERDSDQIRIREVEALLAGVFGKNAQGCSFNGTCTGYFCIEYNGKIFPCDRASNNQELLFGDLSTQSLSEILSSKARIAYAEKVNSQHPECKNCEWKNSCHNGCTMHRINGPSGKYFYCEARKTIFSYLKEKVEEWKRESVFNEKL